MQVKAGMGGQIVSNRFGGLRAGVVDDQVQGQRRRRGTVDLCEELAEFGAAMAPGYAAERLARGHVDGGAQIRGSLSLLVVRHGSGAARLLRQA